jgi:excinuclease UvrABC nuclease subunit
MIDATIESLIQDIPFKKYTGCYLLYNHEEFVYVGVSCDIAVRLKQHETEKQKKWTHVKYIPEPDYIKAILLENYFIETYKPKYNTAGSKLLWLKLQYKDKFEINKTHYPSGW